MNDLPTIDELRSAGARPRLHGNRFLQIDMDRQGSTRVHMWADILPVGQSFPTQIHDHIFDLHSRVLAGSLIHLPYVVTPARHDLRPTHTACQAFVRDRQDTVLRPVEAAPERAVHPVVPILFTAGREYRFPAFEFHATAYIGYAITFMRKTVVNTKRRPTVLCPLGADPDNVFNRYQYSEAQLWELAAAILTIGHKGGAR